MSGCSSIWKPKITEVPKVGAIVLYPNTVYEDFEIPENYNAHSVGPLTIADGVTVTVASGSTWVIS